MKRILIIIGTRPEAIKLIPVIHALEKHPRLKGLVCVSQQHTDLLSSFNLPADYLLEKNDNPGSLHQSCVGLISKFEDVYSRAKADLIIVQGDTTTTFAAALSAYYSKIPVAHIESGLRTEELFSPWPEEGHRRLIDQISSFYFVPTQISYEALLKEGVPKDKIFKVGNTAIDALRLQKGFIRKKKKEAVSIIVTVHRRENHGKPFYEICEALQAISTAYPEVKIQFFIHPNPAIKTAATTYLSGISNIELKESANHRSFIETLVNASFIITDSGGIQEEAPYLGKPVLIVRNTTARPEGIQAGTARLIGTSKEAIFAHSKELIDNPETLAKMSKVHFPYGNGFASHKIVKVLDEQLCK